MRWWQRLEGGLSWLRMRLARRRHSFGVRDFLVVASPVYFGCCAAWTHPCVARSVGVFGVVYLHPFVPTAATPAINAMSVPNQAVQRMSAALVIGDCNSFGGAHR